MKYMNEYDIQRAAYQSQGKPVLNKAVRFLATFRDEVNAHSDGWAYWKAPVKAAEKLMTLIDQPHGNDILEAEFKKALTPIKSFYTRRGNAAGMSYPEVY